MRSFLLIAVLFCSLQVFAQSSRDRRWMDIPKYGAVKISGLLDKLSKNDVMDRKLSAQDYNTLTVREKFTYHMLHGETFSQICIVARSVPDEHKKIFSHLPDAFGEFSWSERQYNFLKGHRDSVMALIKESVLPGKRVGLNYKHAIVVANGREMIPFLINAYNEGKKDQDLLTVMMLLMQENKYVPFMTSATYIKLYGEKVSYSAYIELNKANQAQIMGYANNFYNSKK